MPVPDFVLALRRHVGHELLWLPGVTAVVLRGAPGDEDVLLVQRSDDHRWTPVTGIVDPGERPAWTAVREVAEEAGVTCEVEALVRVSVTDPVVYPNGDRSQYLDHTFRCRWLAGDPHPADDESLAAGWFAPDALPVDDVMRERIEAALAYDGSVRLD